ncbi:unannotated protein [freshwater metagenome]|uniref:Unannotated protein n=1 Tax=freshwater metagenome TaxID=449393 RepID=A0A6J7KXP2_9ZZZZ|nr:hypothetical protein [Actinomycetota bacterium]MSW37756.1 hypothetical protein [Actinomycetota bacterium]
MPEVTDPVADDVGSDLEARDVAALVASLDSVDLGTADRARQIARLGGIVAARARRAGATAVGSGRFLSDLLVDVVPHIPVRDLDTLISHHRGLTGEALADALVRNSARATSGIGAVGGVVAAAEWAALPLLITVPFEVVVETLAVASVEIKLVGELHAVYGLDVTGTGTHRALAFTSAWASRRGIDPLRPWTVPSVLGLAGRQQLRRRMIGRFARNLGTLAPFLVGALIAAKLNRSQTLTLATLLRDDLRALAGTQPEPQP